MNVYQAIQAVSAEMAQSGIGKSRNNQQQGYSFRGIDEVLNALAPTLPKHGLVIFPRIVSREMTERQTARGNPLFCVTVAAEFDFVSTEDGSTHTVRTYGEAMDTADKATNKAMSVAYKYAAFLTFCIPVEGMATDADTVTHEVAVVPVVPPTGYTDWFDDLTAMAASVDVNMFRDNYRASKRSYREFLQAHDRPALDALVARAAQNHSTAIPA